MTGINTTQPSPFGHLTRERHIESISKPLGRKHNSLELLAGQLSCGHRHTLLAIESGIGATQRSSPRPTAAIKDGVASTGVPRCCNCNAEPWAGSEMSTAGEKGQVIQALPSMVPGCKGRQESPLRPTQEGLKATEQQVRQENTAMHPGLRILSGIQWLRITARAELHGFVSNPQRRGYVIRGVASKKNPLVATEDYSACCFHLCGPARSCHLCLQDQEGHILLWFCRPFRLGLSCLPWCQAEMRVFTRENRLVGVVRQRCRVFSHLLEVCDARGLATMKIRGSWTSNRCFSEQEFQVLSPTDCVVAVIWKKWPSFSEEYNMAHESFGVDMVAPDLSNEELACLLGAAFLLNFMFFEVS